ncbi:MAG: hypothetical protein ACI9PN_001601, partial [Candidatus Azotimanducaceae bacterium]
NEFGYTCQVVRVGQKMANIKYPIIPLQSSSDKVEAVALKTAAS